MRDNLELDGLAEMTAALHCACGRPCRPGETLCDECFEAEMDAIAIADNADVYEEMAWNARLHVDEGPCGRPLCRVHGCEVDPFGQCYRCELEV